MTFKSTTPSLYGQKTVPMIARMVLLGLLISTATIENRQLLLADSLLTKTHTHTHSTIGKETAKEQPSNDFAERHKSIKERIQKNRGKIRNEAVLNPPMIEAEASDVEDDEPVLGVSLKDEARAYPLTMLFGGGGVFELLNDRCGGQPIAASW